MVMHQVCQYKCILSCYSLWAYPGICLTNEKENDSNIPIWTDPFRKNLVSFTVLYDVCAPLLNIQWKYVLA